MDSIKKRYVFSLIVNILLCVPRVLAASFIPKGLGPAAYGDYQFLINNFTVIKNFLDFGSSTAFFTYNAKNEEASTLNIQYLLWWLFQLVLITLLVFLTYLTGNYINIWPGQNFENIALASICVWLFLFAQQLVQFGDSKGLTVLCQKVNLFANYVAALILVLAYYKGVLTIKTAMIIYIAAPVLIIFFLMVKFFARYFATSLPILSGFSKNYDFFKKFCVPLFTVTIAGFLAEFLDRWMLQKFAGSTASGYYSLSYNWAAISLLFFNPMLNIFWREVSQLAAGGKKEKIGQLFTKFAKLLFFITAFISIFLAFNAKDVLLLVAGKKFEGATVAFIVMIFYPLIQVCGQLTGSIYLATERIKLYGFVAILTMIINIIASYFVLAPPNFLIPGFGFGADAYSLKIFATNLIGTEILIYLMGKKHDVNYGELLFHRCVILIALSSGCFVSMLIFSGTNLIFLTIVKFLFYTVCAISFFWAFRLWFDLPDLKNLFFRSF